MALRTARNLFVHFVDRRCGDGLFEWLSMGIGQIHRDLSMGMRHDGYATAGEKFSFVINPAWASDKLWFLAVSRAV